MGPLGSLFFPPVPYAPNWSEVASSLQVALPRVCRQTKEENPSRSPKAQEPAKRKRPRGRHCLSGCPGRLRLGGQKLTGHVSAVTAVAFDGESRRCSVGARARGMHVH